MTWYKALDFSKNPLDIRPNPQLIGLQDQEKQVINHIRKGEICFINGLTGSGKTSLLLRIQKKLKDHSFMYLDAHELPQNFNLEKELTSKRSFLDKLVLRKYPKEKQVLIIDEFQAADPELIMNAKTKWEHQPRGAIKSIVIAQINKHLKNCADSFKERVGNRKIYLEELDEQGLKEMLIKRLSNKKTKRNYMKHLSDEGFQVIIDASGKNPRRVLEYTDLVFDYHHKKFRKENPIAKDPEYKINNILVEEILKTYHIHIPSNNQKINKNKKTTDAFAKNFSDFEQQILSYLKDKPRTEKEVAKKLDVSDAYAKRCLKLLQKQHHLMTVGNKSNCKLWQVTPEVRRLMVEV
ncbi:ATP-binding protein [Candidatus Woesearchaeota archaeon]|nr:ATP-binding protein [Candidatus Woesearchaeota archaeon]